MKEKTQDSPHFNKVAINKVIAKKINNLSGKENKIGGGVTKSKARVKDTTDKSIN